LRGLLLKEGRSGKRGGHEREGREEKAGGREGKRGGRRTEGRGGLSLNVTEEAFSLKSAASAPEA